MVHRLLVRRGEARRGQVRSDEVRSGEVRLPRRPTDASVKIPAILLCLAEWACGVTNTLAPEQPCVPAYRNQASSALGIRCMTVELRNLSAEGLEGCGVYRPCEMQIGEILRLAKN